MTTTTGTTGTSGAEASGGSAAPAATGGPADPAADPASEGGDPLAQDRLPAEKGASRRLLGSLLRPHRARVALGAVLLLTQQAAVQAIPLLVAYAIDHAVPAVRRDDHGPLLAVALGYLVCALGGGVLRHAFIRIAARVNQSILLELRGRIYRHAQALSLDFHDRYTSGRLISRSTSDVQSLRELLDQGLQELLVVMVSTVYIGVLLCYLDLGLGGFALLSFVPLALLVRSYRRRSAERFRTRSTAIAAVIVKFSETLGGIRPVQAFRRERANDAAFGTLNTRHERVNGDTLLEMARFVLLARLVAATGVAAVVLWGAWRVATGGLELGALAAGALYVRRLYEPLDRFAMILTYYASATASLEKIAGLLAQRPGVPEPERPAAPPPRPAGMPGREVVFEDVSFSYRTGGEVLPSFRLTLPAGQTTALVGATGAGKSTLAKLLARFYDPTAGRVLLDGTDVRDLGPAGLRREVVMVAQEAFLFSGTVAENIAVGRPDATREEIEQAARAIGAHDFITSLPEGYDTDVRKRGGRISAGQRQLVAFARVLLADPAVVVLDEATSSLDIPGEKAVQEAMVSVLRGRTSLVIAHRLSTVEVADRVLVMDRGRLVEDGSPAELIAGTGRFSALHRAWRESLA